METLTAEHFGRLAEVDDAWCVSLLMPTHPTGSEKRQDPIRFKNLLGKAEEALIARGRRAADARKRLEPLRELIDDATFWTHQREGLAVYYLPQETLVFGVPFPLPERVTAAPHAYVVPLIPIVSEDSRFYVLALSPKEVRLLEGTRHTARQLDLPGWPEDFEQFTAHIEGEPQLQFHTEAAPDAGDRARAAVFHGHPGGEASSEHKERLLEYCRMIDQRVRDAVGNEGVPLILACDERLAAIYRKASDYSRVVKKPVAGNPNERKPAELCRDAWQVMRPQVQRAREDALSRYHQAAANGQAAGRLDAVLPTAHEGRVDTLLVAADGERWGRYDPGERRLDVHDRPEPHDEDLVNLAAVVAYRQGAAVHLLPQDQMPDNEQTVAALRF